MYKSLLPFAFVAVVLLHVSAASASLREAAANSAKSGKPLLVVVTGEG